MSRIEDLSHNDLIKHMAENCGDNAAWREFLERFQNFIASVIINECKRLDHTAGLHTIGDLLHTVYMRLLANDCRALKNFKGQHENSIIAYLKLIALNVVRTDKNGSPIDKFRDLRDIDVSLDEIFMDTGFENEVSKDELIDAVEHALQEIAEMRRNGGRDVLIFRYYFFENFEVEDITELHEFRDFQEDRSKNGIAKLSTKRIANIISEIKAELRECLVHEGY